MQISLQFDEFFDRKNFKILISRRFEIITKTSHLKLVGTPCICTCGKFRTLENFPWISKFSGVSGMTSPSTLGANQRGKEKNMNMELPALMISCWVCRLKQLTMSSPFSEEHSNLLASSTAASWGLLCIYWSQRALPDKAMAPWKRPLAWGDMAKRVTEAAPESSPKSVT